MSTHKIVRIAAAAAIIAVLAPMSLPFGAVPISMQTLIIPLLASLLTLDVGLSALGIYLVLGMIGLPVYAGFTGGIGHFATPTGGYLLAMVLFPLILGPVCARWRGVVPVFISNLVVAALQLIVGSVWLAVWNHMAIASGLAVGAVAFAGVTLVKVVIVTGVVTVVNRQPYLTRLLRG